jgi:hypothetical protein
MKIGYYVEETDENGNPLGIEIPFNSVPGSSATFTIDNSGYYNIYYYAKDIAGNLESTNSESLKIDQTPPETTCNLDGITGENGWFIGTVSISLQAEDSLSGVHQTYYSIDRGFPVVYEAPFEIRQDGSHIVTYYSVDNAGNIELTNQVTVKIDTIAPDTAAILPPCPGRYYTAPVTVTLHASDETSGIEDTYYKVDFDSSWNIYHEPFVVSGNGRHKVIFYSVDNAGNTEMVKTRSFSIYIRSDILPPR